MIVSVVWGCNWEGMDSYFMELGEPVCDPFRGIPVFLFLYPDIFVQSLNK